MDISSTLSQITSLSVDDRLRLVEAIWDSIAADGTQPKLTEAQRQELDRRLANHVASPDDVVPWEEVRSEARTRAQR
jgi:putative addiction module component (TIGR02574 family)